MRPRERTMSEMVCRFSRVWREPLILSCMVIFGDGGVPVFPDRFEPFGTEHGGDLGGGSFVRDFELASGVRGGLLGFEPFAVEGDMEISFALSGVAAGFGEATCAHHSDTERGEEVAECGGFAGAENDTDMREGNAESADGLDKSAVGEGMGGGEATSRGSNAGEADREERAPAGFLEVIKVSGKGEGLGSPVV